MTDHTYTPLLQALGIRKSFGIFSVLKGVDFSLHESEIVGITGPNGSGKTTLLNILSGLIVPDEGDVYFRGKRMTGLTMEEYVAEGVVRTFQIPQTFGSFSVRDSIRVAAYVSGKRGRQLEDFVDRILEITGLTAQRYVKAKKLSQGCLRRLEFARALCSEPEVILLDEIFSGLSIVDQREMEDLMATLNKREGITFLMVSHNLMVIEELCKRALVIEDGLVAYEGGPEGLRGAIH